MSTAKVIINFKKDQMQFLQRSDLDVLIDNETAYKVSPKMPLELELPAGQHTFRMSFRYLWRDCGVAVLVFDFPENSTHHLTYEPPMMVFSEGKIFVA